jgi:hypothetical protein
MKHDIKKLSKMSNEELRQYILDLNLGQKSHIEKLTRCQLLLEILIIPKTVVKK